MGENSAKTWHQFSKVFFFEKKIRQKADGGRWVPIKSLKCGDEVTSVGW
jgi:hypothetical protein